MAIWQFRFGLVPIAGLMKIHGRIVETLPEYRPHNPEAPFDEDREFPNYWQEAGIPPSVAEQIAALIPQRKSWASDAVMFGEEKGNDVQIWPDDIYCRIDARSPNLHLLRLMLKLGAELDCMVVLKGEVIPPDLELLLDRLERSGATEFARDPQAYLRKIANSD